MTFIFYYVAPTLTLIPEVATILPGQEEIILMCITNSASLRVTWYSSSFPVAVGHNSTLRVEVVPDTTDMEYNCSVTDPTSGNVVATAVVPVRRIQGECVNMVATVYMYDV